MKPFETLPAISQRTKSAFSRLELLVVVLTVTVLLMVLLPALARTHVTSQSPSCLSNLRQLTLGWILYADDSNGKLAPNRGAFPPNPDYNSPPAGVTNRARWVGGDMRGGSVGLPYTIIDAYNTNLLVDPNFSLLGPYTRNPALFKCPADLSTWFGQPRVRSYSMSASFGCAYNGTAQDPGHSPIGHWLPGQPSGGSWRVYLKKSDLSGNRSPADLILLVEEHPDSVNDATFAFQMPQNPSQTYWVDLPTKVHNNSANFSFADGHAETHRWQNPQVLPPLIWAVDTAPSIGGSISALPQNADVLWFAHHASAPIPGVVGVFQP